MDVREVPLEAQVFRLLGFSCGGEGPSAGLECVGRYANPDLKCPDLELNVLMSMENVTTRVQAAVKPGMTDRDALTARRAEIARTEKESLDKTGLRSDVVTLYQGGEYWLYRYKRYTDIRVVFAPEEQRPFMAATPTTSPIPMQNAATTYKTRFFSSIGRSQAALPTLALTLVQYVTEVAKPDAQRLPGFHEAQLESLRFELLSPAPVYPAMDTALLATWLQEGQAALGSDSEYIRTALGGRAPADAARELIGGTKIGDPAVRKVLLEGGHKAVDASTDPLIVLARKLDPLVREQQRWMETNVDGPLQAAGEKIGRARFDVYGRSISPDATFTLRLSYGTVKDYPMNGTVAPPRTTLFGLYDRSLGFFDKPPFNLPSRFTERRDRLDLATPVNFVSTNDIVGGNSGSPVVNREGELVGLIFDGNIESLVGTYVYSEENNRAVAVHAAYITEALKKLYDAAPVVAALEGAGPEGRPNGQLATTSRATRVTPTRR